MSEVPGIPGNGQSVVTEQRAQCLDMARFGRPDVGERAHVAEVGNHLVVCCLGAVFIVECLVQGMDFCLGQIVHESSSVVKNGDGSDAREQQHQLTHRSGGAHLSCAFGSAAKPTQPYTCRRNAVAI